MLTVRRRPWPSPEKSEFSDGDGALSECCDGRLSLLGGDHIVVKSVDDEDGLGDLVGIVDGGALPV